MPRRPTLRVPMRRVLVAKKHDEAKDADTHEIEVAILPRETWDLVKDLLEVFEEALQEANELSKAPRDDASRLAALNLILPPE